MNATVIQVFTILMLVAAIAFMVYELWQIRRRATEVDRLIESERSRIAGETRPVVISLGEVETKELYRELCRRDRFVVLLQLNRPDVPTCIRWNTSPEMAVAMLRDAANAMASGNVQRLDEQ